MSKDVYISPAERRKSLNNRIDPHDDKISQNAKNNEKYDVRKIAKIPITGTKT